MPWQNSLNQLERENPINRLAIPPAADRSLPLCGRLGGLGLRGLAAVAAERSRRRKFAEFMSDHVFRHEHLEVQLAVMNQERLADELGNDRAFPGPGFDRLALARGLLLLDLGKQLRIDVRSLF